LLQIHAWIEEASELDFVAVPLRDLRGGTVQEQGGILWELSPCKPGAPDMASPPGLERVNSGFKGLAAFHEQLAHYRWQGSSPGLRARAAEINHLLAGEFDDLEQALSSAGNDPLHEPARRWLILARAKAPEILQELHRAGRTTVPVQPCLRDVRAEHLLFEGSRLTGLIDYGAMAFDSVVADLTRLMTEWIGPDRALRAKALDAYSAIRPLVNLELSLMEAYERPAALLGGGHWVRWHFLEKRTFDDPKAVENGIRRGFERLVGLV
jgi:homoserine kinase type II